MDDVFKALGFPPVVHGAHKEAPNDIPKLYDEVYELRSRYLDLQEEVPTKVRTKTTAARAVAAGIDAALDMEVPETSTAVVLFEPGALARVTEMGKQLDIAIAAGYSGILDDIKQTYAEIREVLSCEGDKILPVHLEVALVTYDDGQTFVPYVMNELTPMEYLALFFKLSGRVPTMYRFMDDRGHSL